MHLGILSGICDFFDDRRVFGCTRFDLMANPIHLTPCVMASDSHAAVGAVLCLGGKTIPTCRFSGEYEQAYQPRPGHKCIRRKLPFRDVALSEKHNEAPSKPPSVSMYSIGR